VARNPLAATPVDGIPPRVVLDKTVGICGALYVYPKLAGREFKLRAYGSNLVCEEKEDAAAWKSLPEPERERGRKVSLAALEAAQLQNVRRRMREMHFRAGMRFMTGSALRARRRPPERYHRGPVRMQNRRREPRRRSVSRGPRRARAPGRSGDDEPEPERDLERRDAARLSL
jgi:hypothetical protein